MNQLSIAFNLSGKTFSNDFFKFQKRALMIIVNTIGLKNPSTKAHSLKVAEYGQLIAEELGLSKTQAQIVEFSGLIHDVGKMAIPSAILNKPAQLTRKEFELIETHPSRGAEILKDISGFECLVPAVLYHHERFDGLGYPGLLRGKQIPLTARIIAVADAFDAMTNERPYRSKVSFMEAFHELIKNSGTQFDGEVVSALCSAFNKIRQ